MKEIIGSDGRVEFAPDPRDQFVRGMNEATCGYAFDRGPGGRREGIPYTPEEEADLKTYYDAVNKTWLAAEVDKGSAEIRAGMDVLIATGAELDRLTAGIFMRKGLIEGHPDARLDPMFGGWVESDEAFRARILARAAYIEREFCNASNEAMSREAFDVAQNPMRTAYANLNDDGSITTHGIPLTKIVNVNVTISPELRESRASMSQPLVWTLRGTRYYASDACSTFMLKRQGGYWKLWISGHKTNAGYPELWYAKWGIDRLRGVDFREVRP